jgi:quercetin dioxygenase-like cupin family protein
MNPTRSSERTEKPQVRRIGTSDGDLLSLLGTVTRLKVSSRETLETFFIGEAMLPPNAFVPLHYHPDVEVFLVLNGTLEVMQASNGNAESLSLASGELALISSNAVHGFRNTSTGHVHLMVIGGPGIEAFLVEAASPRGASGEVKVPSPEEFERMLEIAKRHGQVFVGDSTDLPT